LKGTIVGIEEDAEREKIWFSIELDKPLTELEVMHYDIELLDEQTPGKSVIKFYARRKKESDEDKDFADDTDIPFQIAYAVSIHKAQGLEYESVKIVITDEVEELISHNIFYTAITRAKSNLKIYWTERAQRYILDEMHPMYNKQDASIIASKYKLKMYN
jgi:superfamily I DNA/RNA helicase